MSSPGAPGVREVPEEGLRQGLRELPRERGLRVALGRTREHAPGAVHHQAPHVKGVWLLPNKVEGNNAA